LKNAPDAWPYSGSGVNTVNGILSILSGPYCHQESAWLTQYKFLGSYQLPVWGIQMSGTFQSLTPDPLGTQQQDYNSMGIAANYVATNALIAPSLGRNLSAGPNATVTANLVQPGTSYGARSYQTDLRLAKTFTIARGKVQGFVGIVTVDFRDLEELRPAIASAREAFDPLAVAQIISAAEFGRDEDIIWMLCKSAFWVAQKAEAFSGYFHDALGIADFVFPRRQFSPDFLGRKFGPLVPIRAVLTVRPIRSFVPLVPVMPLVAFRSFGTWRVRAQRCFHPRQVEAGGFLLGNRDRNRCRLDPCGASLLLHLLGHMAGNVNRAWSHDGLRGR